MAEENSEQSSTKRKSKKKKSVLSNAKKYGKKDWWGRGSQIPEDMYHYLVSILEVMKNGFTADEEKANFVNNVLERTINEEVSLSCNQLGCRIIEELLPFSTPADLERFVGVFSEDLRVLGIDKYASFVLEQLLSVCCQRALEANETETTEEPPPMKKKKSDDETPKTKHPKEHIENCYNFTIKVSKFLLNNLEDFVWDASTNSLLRTSLKCLGGVVSSPCERARQNLFKNDDKTGEEGIPKNVKKNNMPLAYREVPEEFKEIVKEHANRLTQWPQFTDMPYQTITSGLLQMLVFALGNSCKKTLKKVAKQLLDESFAPDSWTNSLNDDEKKDDKDLIEKGEEVDQSIRPPNLPLVFDSEPAVRLLEALLHVARSKTYTQIYAKCFINRLAILVVMPGLNFTVQRLFDNCTEKEEFEPMFDELAEKFDKILICGNTGVLVAIAKACLRLQSKQVKFIQAMEQALQCTKPENHKYFAVLCARLVPLNRVDVTKLSEAYFVNIHGSVVLQTMLSFQRPKQIIDSLLAMTPKELTTLFFDAKGCHIADSYCGGKFVGVKSKELLVKKLKGTFQDFATAKYGSRALEKIFSMSAIEQKVKIMEELSNKSQILNSTMFGQLILTKLKVELYKKSFQNWKASLDKEEKTKSAFKDILPKST
ncbi:nucleolar protein 9 [Arctopsyche grandis]|uniref:nucleolar protein 9 n=1 Tax=Arctopsyche grandis TaxID=121162 RepID=UPI00406D931F